MSTSSLAHPSIADFAKRAWLKVLATALHFLALVGLIVSFDFTQLAPVGGEWKTETRFWFPTWIYTFTIAPDGSPWAIADPKGKDQVLHVSEDDNRSLNLPSADNPVAGINSYPIYSHSIAIDRFGRPWLPLGREGLIYWKEAKWERFSFAVDVCAEDIHSLNDKIWLVSSFDCKNDPFLIGIDPATNGIQILKLPEQATLKGLEIEATRVTPDGSLLVLAGSGEQISFFLLTEGAWQHVEYKLDVPLRLIGRNFTMDANGNLWALASDCEFTKCDYRQIGKYNPDIPVWQWKTLPCDTCFALRYQSIAVDSRGRLWVETRDEIGWGETGLHSRYYTDVFEMTATGEARKLVRYSEENSNYQDSIFGGLRVGPDGRVWTGQRNLLWIDATTLELPRPWPDWLAFFASRAALFTVWFPLMFVVITLRGIANRREKTQRKKKT
jgi:hypothetical protein